MILNAFWFLIKSKLTHFDHNDNQIMIRIKKISFKNYSNE